MKTGSKMPDPIVYIVDDDDAVRQVLRWLITSVDLPVAEYKSADDFLAAFKPNAVGCLLLDVRMPGMSGLELQRRISRDCVGFPIIILTGHADVPMAIEAMKNGAFDFIEKPFNNQNLLDIVQKGITESLRLRDKRAEDKNREQRLSSLTTGNAKFMIWSFPVKQISLLRSTWASPRKPLKSIDPG